MERKGYTPYTPEQRNQREQEVFARLERQVEAITTSEQFQAYLHIQSRFHDYSSRNVLLIMAQNPEATRVAGIRKWNELGRFVNKGEKGLDILAPVFPKGTKKDEEQLVGPSGFIPVKVFDISQTNGKDIPEHRVPVLEREEGQWLYPRLTQVGLKHDFLVLEEDNLPGAAGLWHPKHKSIHIARTIDGKPASTLQKTKSLAHELAHGLNKHGMPEDRATRAEAETVAEGSAFVVLDHFGLDSGERSFPYIAQFARDIAVFKRVLGTIQRTSRTIIDDVLELAGAEQPATPAPDTTPRTRTAGPTGLHRFYGFERRGDLPPIRLYGAR